MSAISEITDITDTGWARMFARVMVGILFFMAGWWKCFELTPVAHARGAFVEDYAETWIPAFLLWGLGLAIPVVELVAGALLIVGWRTREALITIGFVLPLEEDELTVDSWLAQRASRGRAT